MEEGVYNIIEKNAVIIYKDAILNQYIIKYTDLFKCAIFIFTTFVVTLTFFESFLRGTFLLLLFLNNILFLLYI